MTEEKITKKFRFKKMDETRNYFIQEIQQNDLISMRHQKVCTAFNHIEQSLFLVSAITGCFPISAFGSLVGIPIAIASSVVGLNICAISAGIKKYKSTIKKRSKKHDKIILFPKAKLNTTEVLICKDLIDSNISHNNFALVNDVLQK